MTSRDRIVLIVVTALGGLAVLDLLIIGMVAFFEVKSSDVLIGGLVSTLGGTVGALGSLLVSTRGSDGAESVPVVVTNTTDTPVPTKEKK